MGYKQDLAGKRFGRLTVLKVHRIAGKAGATWLCLCDCGVEKLIDRGALVQGFVNSCGCLKKELVRERMEEWHKKNSQEKKFMKDLKLGQRLKAMTSEIDIIRKSRD